ncbi:SPOR domain-containing protein [Sphingomonas sp.]|jgi:hypothetical protein|uniref:SPOR domain-containing protein n=1 Tax=Sphingomonas sp. TaxID=28214 RepID=UPI002D7EDA33|nr:SPOR domain-containing protein [Sphingomonas sp.]HEU0043657.1 SPOR domain-containing protein [Sphingomonas sp.]
MRIGLLTIAVILAAVPALADVKAGVDAWARGDFRKAVEEWRGPAIAGDADAQFNLGQAYKLGRGVPVDPALAESWFRKAALQGHEQAQDNYALAMFQSGRKQEALPWLEKSVARDEPRTQLVLGTMLFNGDGVARNYPRAYALMTRAAAPRAGGDGLQSARETLQQMDGYISAVDREKGTKLAQQYAAAGAALPAPVVREGSVRATQPVQTAEAPPSKGPDPKPAPAKVTGTKPAPKPTPVAVKTAPAKPAPIVAKPAAAPAKGGWKVQLGAFRDRGNAEGLWTKVGAKLGNAAPAYVTGGGVTRLQATGFASRATAQAACNRSGVACVVVAP